MMSETLLLEDYHGIGGTGMQLHLVSMTLSMKSVPSLGNPAVSKLPLMIKMTKKK